MENIDIDSPQGITLFTDEESVALDHVDFELEQYDKLRGTYRKVTVFNNKHCYQTKKNRHKQKHKYRVDLTYLNHRPYRRRKIAWKWVYGAIATAGIAALIIYIDWFSGWINPSSYLAIAEVVTISAGLIYLLLAIQSSHDKILFKSYQGKVVLIELLNQYPDKAHFHQFVKRFIKQIKKARADANCSQSDLLAKELKELRRLKNEHVISENQYESAKLIIFKHGSFAASNGDNSNFDLAGSGLDNSGSTHLSQ